MFQLACFAVLAYILYSFFKSYFQRPRATDYNPPPNNAPGNGWFPGNFRSNNHDHPPPPYNSQDPYAKSGTPGTAAAWTPGFWTGTLLGGLGASYFANRNNQNQNQRYAGTRSWDWERPGQWQGQPRSRPFDFQDRGEGSSTGSASLGSMRRSTTYGGSNVR